MTRSLGARSVGMVAIPLVSLACTPAHREPPTAPPVPVERVGVSQAAAEKVVAPTPTSDVWVDLETLSVELRTGRVRPRASVIESRYARVRGERLELVEHEKVMWSATAPTGDASSVVADAAVVVGNGSGLRGFDRKTGALLWNVREQATSSLQWFAADDDLGYPEIVVGVDARPSLPAGAHRTLVARATATGRELFRHPLPDADRPLQTSIKDGRILVVESAATTTVVDADFARSGARRQTRTRLPLGTAQTFDEAVRWVGGYRWSSGDLLLSSHKRLARIEFTSTSPEYTGTTVWSLPPVAGPRGGALLTGPVDRSPNEVEKYICFYGYDPERDVPVALAFVEALARGEGDMGPRALFRGAVEPLGVACGPREVSVVDGRGAVFVIVACDRGAVVERRSLPSGTLLSRVDGRT